MEKSPDSGLRAALTAEEIERFERREKRETLPAPPEGRDEAHDAKFDDDDNSF
jgi:hypothetical protein